MAETLTDRDREIVREALDFYADACDNWEEIEEAAQRFELVTDQARRIPTRKERRMLSLAELSALVDLRELIADHPDEYPTGSYDALTAAIETERS